MNKNLIILIIIVLGWFLVIRPLSTKDNVVQEANDPEEDEESAKKKDDEDEDDLTPYPDSDYVEASKGIADVDDTGIDWDALINKYGNKKTYTN